MKTFDELPKEIQDKMLERQKVMMVSDYPITPENKGLQRVVFIEKCGKYIAWNNAATFEDAENSTNATSWEYAIDIPQENKTIPSYTMEELFDKLGEEFIIKKS